MFEIVFLSQYYPYLEVNMPYYVNVGSLPSISTQLNDTCQYGRRSSCCPLTEWAPTMEFLAGFRISSDQEESRARQSSGTIIPNSAEVLALRLEEL